MRGRRREKIALDLVAKLNGGAGRGRGV